MATLSPAIPLEEIKQKLDELNIPQRFSSGLLRDPEFKQLQYKNHQLCYLHEYMLKTQTVKLTNNQLAFVFSMNRRTVTKSINQGPQDPKPKGRHLALDENTENIILEKIINISNQGDSMTQNEILKYIRNKFKKNVTKGWLNQFYLRHRDKIKKTRSFPQEDLRITVPREYLKEHVKNMHKYVEGRVAELTFNLDEVGTSEWEDRKPRKVFADINIDSNHLTHPVSRKVSHMTLLTCVSAAGDSLTPLLITKHELRDDFWELGIRPDEDIMVRVRDPPYIDKELFFEYISVVLIPYISHVRSQLKIEANEAILLMDSCSAHCDDSIKKYLGENNVIAFVFPSHTTNLFQALDLSLFGIFKRTKNMLDNEEKEKSLKKAAINVFRAYDQITTLFNILGSFRRAGIIQDTSSNPKKIKINIKQMVSNPGFKELWNLNVKIEDISRLRQNHKFGIINIDYLPEGCCIVMNEDDFFQEDDEIEHYFD